MPSRGITVLLVEDNEVNQMVATGLLQSLGYDVDAVGDGEAAIAALRGDHPYDVVLMDLRMPHVDGYDATRAIRAEEAGRRRVPILAMTASALEGEQERCLAAGMDDFLTKPVDPVHLDRTLMRWTDATERTAAGVEASTSSTGAQVATDPGDDGVLDLARINVLHELRMDGVSFFERTAAAFSARVPTQLADLRDAAAVGDAGTLKTVAHQLKGSALNLGLPRLGAAAAALEAASGQPSSPEARACLDTVDAEASKALAALTGATARSAEARSAEACSRGQPNSSRR